MTGSSTAQLRDLDKNVRIQAAIDLGTAGDGAALDALVSALTTEPDFFVRETLVWALVRMGADAVDPMLELVETAEPEVQLSAVQVLGKLGDGAAAPALVESLEGALPAVRDRIVFSLGQIGDPQALPALVAMLGTNGESATTLTSAIERFGESAIPALLGRLEDANPAVRAQVVDLLGFTGSAAVLAPLARALADPEADVRLRAVTALATVLPAATGDHRADRAEAMTALRHAADDDDRRVQLLARHVLESADNAEQ